MIGCLWTHDGEDYLDGGTIYDTSCDNRHEFIVGGVAENNYKFCPYCGKKLIATEREEININKGR